MDKECNENINPTEEIEKIINETTLAEVILNNIKDYIENLPEDTTISIQQVILALKKAYQTMEYLYNNQQNTKNNERK